ncbi:MAG: hypothetical protein QGI24_06090 [Kiritimatiellia bacterium]|jgi:hypothetical protein|nr:hypothetical protein [Kiritimatiellia bacterium]MDP6848339.1 hypothetical protein [Kiritimatiellia bacterium]
MKKLLIVIVILIAAAIAINLLCRDIPPPDVTDLKVQRPQVSSNENAYTYFDSATNALHWPTNASIVTDYLAGEPVPEEQVLDVIDRNEEMFRTVDEGLQCAMCLAPELTGFDSLLPYLADWRNIGRVLAFRTRYQRLSGSHAEAALTCVSLLRFGDLLQHDAECLVNYLVGIAVLEIGLQQARDIAQDDGSTDCELSALSTALAELGPFDHGLVRAMMLEYKGTSKIIDDVINGKFSLNDVAGLVGSAPSGILKRRRIPRYFLQPNKTRAEFATFYRNVISNAPLPYADMNLYDVEEAFGIEKSKVKLMTRPNGVGKILCALMIPAVESLLERKCRTETSVAATSLMVALHGYELKKGIFPETVDKLVPDYLASIPSDPYDGRPFRYDPSKGVVYSVGKDLEDSGGSSTLLSGHESDAPQKKRWDGKDIVFRIEGLKQRKPLEREVSGDIE